MLNFPVIAFFKYDGAVTIDQRNAVLDKYRDQLLEETDDTIILIRDGHSLFEDKDTLKALVNITEFIELQYNIVTFVDE